MQISLDIPKHLCYPKLNKWERSQVKKHRYTLERGIPMAVTILDIALKAGTSKSTVSRYLNGGSISQEKAQQIEQAIAALDYRPNVNARRLVSNCTNMIGIVFDDISNYIYGEMMAGIQSVAGQEGYGCMFLSRAAEQAKESDYLSLFSSSTVDGLISVTLGQRDAAQVRTLRDSGLPIVLVGDASGVNGLPTIDVDNLNGTRMEVDYLIQQGHRRIAYLKGPSHMPAAHSRLKGYLKALSDADIPPEDGLIREVSWTVADAYKSVTQLLKEESFTALVGSNAYSTYGGVQAIIDSGRSIPSDIAIAGFDDAAICEHTRPSITTLNQPFQQMGRMAANQLIARIQGDEESIYTTYVLPKLVLRETTQK